MRCILEALLPHVPALVCDDVQFNLPVLDGKVDDFVITTVCMDSVPPELKGQPHVWLYTRIHPDVDTWEDAADCKCARCGAAGARNGQSFLCDACHAEERCRFPMLARARPVTLPLRTN